MSDAALAKVEPVGGNIVASTHGESAALISMIERAARDPAVNIEKMERLFEMHERIEARQAEKAFNVAMSATQAELQPIIKNKMNDHTKAKYADLYAIADTALPIIHKHGFGLSFSECAATLPNCQGIACRASHSSGHAEHYQFNIPIDAAGSQGKTNKTATQAYGSTFTYGRRYATCGVFNLIITDQDGNGKTPPSTVVTDDQAEELAKLVTASKTDIVQFLAIGNLESLSDMPAKDFKAARQMLLDKITKAKP
jgi:ERF superfamily